MKVSIITPVLNSHEIVRRQLLHYSRMLEYDLEVVLMDDGSEPPLKFHAPPNVIVRPTNDFRPWTEHKARNMGAKLADGEYLLFIDVDYVIPLETIERALAFDGDRMGFRRRFGILDENGETRYDIKTLKEWNLKNRWIRKGYFPGHRSQFLIRKDLFWDLGGYNEGLEGVWRRTGGAGERFWRKWQRWEEKGKVKIAEEQPTIFMFPSGKFCEHEENNPFGLFHDLKHA